MTTTTERAVALHPIGHGEHDEGCTEGLSDEQCDEVCTAHNKRLGICVCKRSERD